MRASDGDYDRVLSRMDFAYSQFLVFDKSVSQPGCQWTPAHVAQGFARRDSTVCFGTMLEYGEATVLVASNASVIEEAYERIVAVPFVVVSGQVIVEGPEETRTGRKIQLNPGFYRLVAAQRIIGDCEEVIILRFDSLATPLENSEVIRADPDLHPSTPLVEWAEIAS